nr:uncharacterized protein LOC109153269 [Ipomoea batatas]
MSLNCLTCHRSNSLRGGIEAAIIVGGSKARNSGRSLRRHQVRSWSGNLVPSWPAAGHKNGAATSNPGRQKAEGRGVSQRRHSGPVECETPRLVRSSGMRREWSFEDLRQNVKA